MDNDGLLEVKHLRKYFPVKSGFLKKTTAYVKATDDVSFTIRKGETFGLVGESGCGKTTIGKLILRLYKADSGELIYKGTDLEKLSDKQLKPYRSKIQIIFQDPYGSLNPKMKVKDIIAEGVKKFHIVPKEEVDDYVIDLLKKVGLHESDAERYPHEFSGGQRQRIVVAKALAFKPELIVCDEPVSALDVSVQAQVLNLLVKVQKELGISYLFIAHGMAVVKHISTRVGVMYLGRMVEVAQTDELFDHCAHPYTEALLSAVPVANPFLRKEFIPLEGEVPNPINPPSGCPFHPRCKYACDRCSKEMPSLVQVGDDHSVACFNYKEVYKT